MKTLSVALLCLLPGIALAQQSPDELAPQRPIEFVDAYNARHLTKEPKLGSVVPDIKAWDEKGGEFQLGSTRGKHTVIIFGCLT